MTPLEGIRTNVNQYGWDIINVEDADLSPFSYTVGLYQSFAHPDFIISGLKGEVAFRILNDISSDVRAGDRREPDVTYNDVFNGVPCVFKKMNPQLIPEYLGFACRFYGFEDIHVLQCVWPDKNNKFPWETGYNINIQEALY